MLTVGHTNCASTGELLDRALDAVEFYGFDSIEHVLKAHKPSRPVKATASPLLALAAEKKLAALTKNVVAHRIGRDNRPQFAYHLEQANSKISSLGLHAIGSRSAITEGM